MARQHSGCSAPQTYLEAESSVVSLSQIEELRAKRLCHHCVGEEFFKAEIRWQLSGARPLQVRPARALALPPPAK